MIRSWSNTTLSILKYATFFGVAFFCLFLFGTCDDDRLVHIANTLEMNQDLSGYAIFQGDPVDLMPAEDFHVYELATELFTDYAEKQRLIKLPAGFTLKANGEGLPDFPEGTILVKTFYYYNDKRDPSNGKKVIETRLEIKSNGRWNVGTYLWNKDQTDATLITTGINKTINWIDDQGNGRVIAYRVPSNNECATCHQASGQIIPIGPKLRNLNMDVERNAIEVNQLQHLQQTGILDGVDPISIPSLPRWKNTSEPLDRRARAYLDVNCAHCHNANGIASGTKLVLNYDTPYQGTDIGDRRNAIVSNMERGSMPRLGTSIVDDEGLELIRAYIKNL